MAKNTRPGKYSVQHILNMIFDPDDATLDTGSSGGGASGLEYNATPPTIADGGTDTVQGDANGNTKVTLATLLAGEDLTVGVMKVENRFTGINVTADTQIKAGAGFIHTLTFSCNDAAPTAGSIIVYDSLTEIGTIVYSENFDTTAFRGFTVILDRTFATGLYVGFTTTADINVAVSYR